MSDMMVYLDSVAAAQNFQASAIEAQLQESVEALADMEKMRPELNEMDGTIGQFSKFFLPNYISVRAL